MLNHAILYWAAMVAALIVTPIVRYLAHRCRVLDVPDARKVHGSPVPRLGGIAILLGTLAGLGVMWCGPAGVRVADVHVWPGLLAMGAAGVFVMGVWDDVKGLSGRVKLAALLAAAAVAYAAGVRITRLPIEPGWSISLGFMSCPVTLLWIVGVTVSLNFSDGLDGLAGGIAVIACGVISMIAVRNGQVAVAAMALALFGAMSGFLCFNFNPATIFMGDSGSMFVGFLLAVCSAVCINKAEHLSGAALPALALGVPILDASLTFIRRGVLERRSLFAAEQGHVHHRLLKLGLEHRQVVLALHLATLAIVATATPALFIRSRVAFVFLAAAALMLVMVFHKAGALRVRSTLAAIKRNRAIARQARRDRIVFETAQLQLRAARDLANWWEGMVAAAGKLACRRLCLRMPSRQGGEHSMLWENTGLAKSDERDLDGTFAIKSRRHDERVVAEVALATEGSLEAAGRRLLLLLRLLEECGLDALRAAAEAEAMAGGSTAHGSSGDRGDPQRALPSQPAS